MRRKKIIVLTIVIFISSLYLITLYTDPTHRILRYQPSNLNSHFNFSLTQPFSEYIKQTYTTIKQARTQAKVDHIDLVIAQNSPVALLPNPTTCKKTPQGKYENGILLIHGLFASPYLMQALATHFQNKCFVVYSILLPGHGTIPGDLTKVQAEDWIKTSEFGLNALKKQANNLYIAGHSAGGTLAIITALHHPTQIKALILIAPAFKIAGHFTWAITPIYWLSRIVPSIQWINQADDTNPVKYESFPINAPYQMNILIKKLQKLSPLQNLKLPLFVVQSAEDATIDSRAVFDFFTQLPNPHNKMLWYTQQQTTTTDPRIKISVSAIPAQRILGQSHVSLVLKQNDSYLGRNGTIKECSQYSKHSTKWQECETSDTIYLGEITNENLQKHTLRRITFNPLLPNLLQQIDKFMNDQPLSAPSYYH